MEVGGQLRGEPDQDLFPAERDQQGGRPQAPREHPVRDDRIFRTGLGHREQAEQNAADGERTEALRGLPRPSLTAFEYGENQQRE